VRIFDDIVVRALAAVPFDGRSPVLAVVERVLAAEESIQF
jgi:hypothetical protein